MFEEDGWSVCGEASNGQEAIDKALEFRPDIVILDLSMPLMNGLTAGRILKRIMPEIHLILFSSFDHLLSTEDLRCAGFSASIPKGDAGKLVNTAQTLFKAA